MIQKIKSMLLITIMALIPFGAPLVALSGTVAADNCTASNATQGIKAGTDAAFNGSSCSSTVLTNNTGNSIADIAKTAVNILSLIVGIIAVIMIIYGGLRYITSGGDSGSVGNAKNTLIYAIIGLIIVALAQVIVHFVLNAAINNTVTPTNA